MKHPQGLQGGGVRGGGECVQYQVSRPCLLGKAPRKHRANCAAQAWCFMQNRAFQDTLSPVALSCPLLGHFGWAWGVHGVSFGRLLGSLGVPLGPFWASGGIVWGSFGLLLLPLGLFWGRVVAKMPKCAKNVGQGAQRDAKSDQNGAKSGPKSAKNGDLPTLRLIW